MAISRRDAIRLSGSTLAGLSVLARTDIVLAQASPTPSNAPAPAPAPAPFPDHLADVPLRNLAPLALQADGSAKEFSASEMVPITDPPMWRFTKGEPPAGEYDYHKLKIKIIGNGVSKLGGTLTFADLDKLPKHSQTVLLQCGAPNPRGIVKWTGVRFSDVAKLLGVEPAAHYCRFVGSDRYYTDEDLATVMHPQAMLVWMMNDQPLPPKHGAPVRLVMPFRYGGRSTKAITEIYFGVTSMATPPLPT